MFVLLAQLLAEAATFAEIGHQEEHAGESHDKRHQIGHTGKRVVEAVEQGRHGKGQRIERLAVARVEIGEADEVAADATPQGVEEGQRREACDVEQESSGVVGLHVDRGLVLHTLKDAKGDARHQAIIDQRLGQQRLACAAHQVQEGHHLDKLLGEAHAEHVSHDVDREGHVGEEIEEVELVESGEDDEHRHLREEEDACRGLDVDLPRAKESEEEQSPDDREIERHGIEHEQPTNGQHHQHREREAHDGQHEQPLVVEPPVVGHVRLGEDKLRSNGLELLGQRATVPHLRMEAALVEQFDHCGRAPCLGVARLVVGQERALLHIASHHPLVVGAVLVRISDDVNHFIKIINPCNFFPFLTFNNCTNLKKEGIFMWKNILKGTAIVAVLMAILGALGLAAVNRELKKSFQHPFDDDDVM